MKQLTWCWPAYMYRTRCAERTAASMMAATAVDDLEEKKNELEFGTALAALTIVRYLADHCAALPMGLLGRLTRTNDTIMALVPLLDNPPWVRQSKGKVRPARSAQPDLRD